MKKMGKFYIVQIEERQKKASDIGKNKTARDIVVYSQYWIAGSWVRY